MKYFSTSLHLIDYINAIEKKETSILGAISILDLMNVTKDLIGMYYQTFESLLLIHHVLP